MLKYSFILPIYNVEKYLEECINSILKQEINNYEIILVDDGSPDNCPKICDEYAKKDKRIKVIHKENGGPSSARNAGLNIAKGEYILFVDPDDYIADNYLKTIDSNLKDYDMVIFGYYNLYANKITNEYSENRVLSSKQAMEYLVEDNKYCGFVWNKVYKNELLKKYNIIFDESVTMNEDVYFSYLYMEKTNKVKLIDSRLIYYRQRKSSLMSQKVKQINASSLVKTYLYIINNSKDKYVINKAKTLYLKSYYKYKKYVKTNDFNIELINEIEKKDYKNFSSKDKKIIMMYKYFPVFRTLIYSLKEKINKKFI